MKAPSGTVVFVLFLQKKQAGKTYNMGFAIHEDHTNGRYHYVSMGYTLGVDAKADITAGK